MLKIKNIITSWYVRFCNVFIDLPVVSPPDFRLSSLMLSHEARVEFRPGGSKLKFIRPFPREDVRSDKIFVSFRLLPADNERVDLQLPMLQN